MSKSSDPAQYIAELQKRPTAQFADVISLRERVAVWSIRWEDDDNSFTTSRDVNGTESCSTTSIFDLGGTFFTGADGTAEFLLSDYYCNEWFDFGHGILAFEYPVVFVATPQSNAPVFLTSLQVVVNKAPEMPGPANDVKFQVFSWDTNGGRVGNVLFDWRCSVPMSWDSIFNKPAPRGGRGG